MRAGNGIESCGSQPNRRPHSIDRAVSQSGLNPLQTEMMAEFDDTDVSTPDVQRRSALRWVFVGCRADVIRLRLSILYYSIKLHDIDGFTAFDISLLGSGEVTRNVFYNYILKIEATKLHVIFLGWKAKDKAPLVGRSIEKQ